MKKVLFLAGLMAFTYSLQAEIDPKYKECMQRGYTVDGNYCVFTDGSRCDLDSFNTGKCGQEFMTEDYCIPEGNNVWDNDRCCKGLAPYLKAGTAGQATCQRKSFVMMKNMTDNYGLWGFVIVLTGIYLFMSRNNKSRRKTRGKTRFD